MPFVSFFLMTDFYGFETEQNILNIEIVRNKLKEYSDFSLLFDSLSHTFCFFCGMHSTYIDEVALKCLNRHKQIVSFPFHIMDQIFRISPAKTCQNFLHRCLYLSALLNYSLHLHNDWLCLQCWTCTNNCAVNTPAGSRSRKYYGNGYNVTASVEEDDFWRQSPWW